MKDKLVYKIWDKTNNNYFHKSRVKNQWTSLYWVKYRMRTLISSRTRPRRSDEFEIHAFRMVPVKTMIYINGDLYEKIDS